MPIVFFYFIGTVTGGITRSTSGKTTLAVLVPEDAGFLANQVIRRLEQNGFETARLEKEAAFSQTSPRLRFPANFTEDVLGGNETVLELTREESGLSKDFDELRAVRASFTVLADLAAAERDGRPPTPESLATLDAVPRGLTLAVRPAGERLKIPTGFELSIPGMMVMFTLLVLLTSGAGTLVQERNEGLLKRLASTPITRGELVAGKWMGKMILGAVQIVFAMLAGTVLFPFEWGPSLPMILLVTLGWGSLCASCGLLLGTIARTGGPGLGHRRANFVYFGGTRWLLVADRDHAGLGAGDPEPGAHRLDDGCAAQADQLRRRRCERTSAPGRANCRDLGGGTDCLETVSLCMTLRSRLAAEGPLLIPCRNSDLGGSACLKRVGTG